MWKLIKWLFLLAIIALIVAAVKGYKIGGKTVVEYGRSLVGAKNYDEGVKDLRSLVGESIKAVGEYISPEVTEKERKELENIIKNEIKKEGSQQAAPATTGGEKNEH